MPRVYCSIKNDTVPARYIQVGDLLFSGELAVRVTNRDDYILIETQASRGDRWKYECPVDWRGADHLDFRVVYVTNARKIYARQQRMYTDEVPL